MTDNQKTSAFTSTCSGISRQLINKATIYTGDESIEISAQWDTGATGTCISHEVVNRLKLDPTGMVTIHTPSGEKDVMTYLVNILLPNNVSVIDAQVMDSEIGGQGIDLLIGMDIISLGDFAVTNFDGQTVFSFRTPSRGKIDFVEQVKKNQAKHLTHGKGKRKR